MTKRFVSLCLSVCILFSLTIVALPFAANADAAVVEVAPTTDTNIDYGLVDNVQYGQILHCWNWSFDNIRKNMQLIASQGFTAIQTSPIQSSKESTTESWSSVANSAWVYYQPISFNIETNPWNALGTKTEFKAMCEEAHKYGVKVIVDAVFNHMANDSSENTINPQITSDLRNDSNCWYSITWNTSNWEDRYDVTHNCLSGFPDLNTSNSKVQNYAIGFLKECIDAGADGFRFDAVKHIETPADAYGTASDFWPNVLGTATYHAQQTRGITPYYYGEMLGSPGGGLPITAYTDHMSVTDNNTGNTVRDAINAGNASGACLPGISNGAAPDKAVQWNESHDTYYADNNSIWVSNDNMKKTWAIVGSRAQVCGLYLARPENNETTMLGDGDITAWADKEVKAINRFKNYFAGHGEYLASSGNIVYNERGNTGVVLVNVAGGKTSVSVPAHRMYDGTYTDAITGNHFYVSNGTISGDIGSSGIAVVYSYPSVAKVSESSQAFRGDTLDVKLSYNEATGGTYSINGDYAQPYTDGDVISVGCGIEYGGDVTLLTTATGGTTTDSVLTTYRKLHPDTELTMYFDNSSKNWDEVYAYVYTEDGDKNKSWPGIEMTYDSALGLYKYDVPKGFETSKVVFNNNDNGSQTPSSGGHSFNANTSIYKDGSFYGYNTGISGNIYFKPTDDWKSDNARFAVYVWNDSSKVWLNLKDTDSDGVYEATLPSGVWKECIFGRMDPSTTANNWDNVWNRTGDLGLSNNNNYFMIGEGWNTSEGVWSIIDKSVVGSDSDAYLSGSFNNWSDSSTPFVYTDYNKAVASVDLPAGTYTFKMLKGGNWFGNPGTINDTTAGNGWRMCRNDDKNCTLVASGGEYTFTLNTETLKVNVDYEAKEVVPPTEKPTEKPTQAPTEKPTQAPTEKPTEAPTEKPTEAPTVKPTETPTEKPTVAPTLAPTSTTSAKTGYYLVGTLNGKDCWGVSSLSSDRLLSSNPNNAGEYMLDYTFTAGDEIKVVYFNGTDYTTWYGSGDNYSIGSSKSGKGTIYFRPEGNSSWSYNYLTVIPKTSALSKGYYLVGTLGGVDKWGKETLSSNRLLKENAYNAGEYMLDYTFKAGDEIKVVYYDGTDFTNWYSSGDNYSIGSSKAGECTLYFRPEGNSSWSYKYFTVIQKTPASTVAPTVAPTQAPTQAPTEKPTVAPTEAPTQAPTVAPTEAPTEAPTQAAPEYTATATSDANSITISWSAPNAVKTWIHIGTTEANVKSYASTTTASTYTIKNRKPDTTYYYKLTHKVGDKVIEGASGSIKTLCNDATESVYTATATSDAKSITINWTAPDAVKTWIHIGTTENNVKSYASTTTGNTYTIKNRTPDTTYYYKLIHKVGDLVVDGASGSIKTLSSEPEYTATATSDLNSITISWTAPNATKTWIHIGTTEDNVKSYASTTASTYTIKNRTPDTKYYYKLTHKVGDKVVDGASGSIRTTFNDTVVAEYTDSGTVVTWKAYDTATKYWVVIETDSGTKTYSTTEATYTLKNAPVGTPVTVKAVATIDGVKKIIYYKDTVVV